MAKEDQFQNPQGEEGQAVIKEMNEHHRDLSIWGLSNIPKTKAVQVLDIGCGGGASLKSLSLKYPNAKCHGIDISEESVKATLEYNKYYVQWGKIDAQKASVENIPFPENSLDVVTSIESYFFWPDVEKNLAHIASRMKTGGVLCIVSEQYFTPANHADMEQNCQKYHMKLVENEMMKAYMVKAGFSVEMFLDEDKNWVTFIGTKN